jgi:hypothetical protein
VRRGRICEGGGDARDIAEVYRLSRRCACNADCTVPKACVKVLTTRVADDSRVMAISCACLHAAPERA